MSETNPFNPLLIALIIMIPILLIVVVLSAVYDVIAERHCNEKGMLFVEQNHEFILCKDIDENGNFNYKKFYDLKGENK